MGVCQSRRSSAGLIKCATFPLNGPCTLANSTTTAPLVVWHLIPAVGMSFNLGDTSYVLCLRVRFSMFFVVHAADMKITDSAQAIVYFTTDVPRTRAYSVNNTHTPHVHFTTTVSSHLRSLTNRLGYKFRDESQRSRLPLLHYR